MASEVGRKLRVGLIGAGEVAQVIHLPVLALMSDLFTTTAICDISLKACAIYRLISHGMLTDSAECPTLRCQIPHPTSNH
jgi:hypothetical protein